MTVVSPCTEMPMIVDTKIIEEILQRIRAELPEGIKEIRDDFDKNLRAILQGIFSKLDLVTREEFDVQVDVLTRTREKFEQLEKQISDLEQAAKKQTTRKKTSSPK